MEVLWSQGPFMLALGSAPAGEAGPGHERTASRHPHGPVSGVTGPPPGLPPWGSGHHLALGAGLLRTEAVGLGIYFDLWPHLPGKCQPGGLFAPGFRPWLQFLSFLLLGDRNSLALGSLFRTIIQRWPCISPLTFTSKSLHKAIRGHRI